MSDKLHASEDYIIIEPAEQKVDETKSKLILGPEVLNPDFVYGKVYDMGGAVYADFDIGDYVYVHKINVSRLNHLNKDYYVALVEHVCGYVFADEEQGDELDELITEMAK